MPKEIKDMTFDELLDEFGEAHRDYNLAYFNCMNDMARIDGTRARVAKVKLELSRRYSSAIEALRREEKSHFVRIVS